VQTIVYNLPYKIQAIVYTHTIKFLTKISWGSSNLMETLFFILEVDGARRTPYIRELDRYLVMTLNANTQ